MKYLGFLFQLLTISKSDELNHNDNQKILEYYETYKQRQNDEIKNFSVNHPMVENANFDHLEEHKLNIGTDANGIPAYNIELNDANIDDNINNRNAEWAQHLPHGDVYDGHENLGNEHHYSISEPEPIFADYWQITMYISYSHALVYIIVYLSLLWKVVSDKAAIGISLQSVSALMVSEVIIIGMTLSHIVYHLQTLPPASFFIIDCPSLILSVLLVAAVHKYWTRYEDELDTWGLNIINYVLYYTAKNQFFTEAQVQYIDHLGRLKAKGTLGLFLKRTYYTVFYIASALLAAVFWCIRKQLYIGSQMTVAHHIHEWSISSVDAIRGLALIPQIYMFSTSKVPIVSSHLRLFISFEILSRILALTYWITLPLFYPRFGMHMRGYNIFVHFINLIAILSITLYSLTHRKKKMVSANDLELPTKTAGWKRNSSPPQTPIKNESFQNYVPPRFD